MSPVPDQSVLERASASCSGELEPHHYHEKVMRDIGSWAHTIHDVYGGLEIIPDEASPFAGKLVRRSVDKLKTVELRVSPQTYLRTSALTESHPSDEVFVTFVVSGRVLIVQGGRTCELADGDFAFVESSSPYTTVVAERGAHLIDFTWRRHELALSDAEWQSATAQAVKSSSTVGRLVAPVLAGVLALDDGISRAGNARFVAGLSTLLTTAALELTLPEESEDRWRSDYEKMLQYVEQNLGEPDLSAEVLAERFFMSSRSVHRIFSNFGTTVASVIRDKRLESTRYMMLSQNHRTQSVSFIASQFGFSSLQVFSRAFSAKFGMSPTKYREVYQGRDGQWPATSIACPEDS